MNTHNALIAPALLSEVMIGGNQNNLNDTANTMLRAHEQLAAKPKIDDVICHNLEGNTQKDALFVIDNIRENKMKIKWSSVNTWSVQYKRHHVCDLKINKGELVIGKVSEILAERVKNMPYDPANTNPLMDALIDLITGDQKAFATTH